MNDADLKRLIRKEIEIALQVITSGVAGTNTKNSEDISSLFPGLPTLTARPIMHPYGLVSRAPKGTISVTAQQGSHPGNKMTLGHRDANSPDIGLGEAALYSGNGYKVWVKGDSIVVGKGGEVETVVVGETLKALLIVLIDAIVAHTHIGNLGAPTGPPQNASEFTQAKGDFVENDKILAKDGGRF